MDHWTRRRFLKKSVMTAAAGMATLGTSCGRKDGAFEEGARISSACGQETVSLCGAWFFRTDPDSQGQSLGWAGRGAGGEGWESVAVPSTWQVSEKTAEYLGPAWYRREFDAPVEWRGRVVRIEFEAVYHTAEVYINGRRAGGHSGKGYTAFTLDITGLLEFGGRNVIAVRADNAFSPSALPRNRSYDWAPDGGITRPVSLVVTPRIYIEDLWIKALPDLAAGTASLEVQAMVHNAAAAAADVSLGFRVIDEATGLCLLEKPAAADARIAAGSALEISSPPALLEGPKLWHFDHPHIYALEAWCEHDGRAVHGRRESFGIRRLEVRGPEILLNGEPVGLVGVERMAGSHPDFGMAEPGDWIRRDHDDLKRLNCVLTRVHWPQDRRVMDYCDRKGILIQVEVPAWGPDTFRDLEGEAFEEITANGLEQLGEMIRRERNHPCLFSWGLGNEVNGQDPLAREFVRRMLLEARRLDPGRLCSYAANSLQTTPERDVAAKMDFIEWNEYYETWFGGDVRALRQNLEAIHRAFPDKPVVISEYGYCACTEDRPENDRRRIEILETHNGVFRDTPWVRGLIFFDYNDYRTHMGDKGLGALRQRVHGVVDLYGARKPSYEALGRQSSPVEFLTVRTEGGNRSVVIRTRKTLPAYTLRGYLLRSVAYGDGGIPLEQREIKLPDLEPGAQVEISLGANGKRTTRFRIDLIRPTGFSAATVFWPGRLDDKQG